MWLETLVCNKNAILVTQLINVKTNGQLIRRNPHFLNLILIRRTFFCNPLYRANRFLAVYKVLDYYGFTFPCQHHESDILFYIVYYYARLRMWQFANRKNIKERKNVINHEKRHSFVISKYSYIVWKFVWKYCDENVYFREWRKPGCSSLILAIPGLIQSGPIGCVESSRPQQRWRKIRHYYYYFVFNNSI